MAKVDFPIRHNVLLCQSVRKHSNLVVKEVKHSVIDTSDAAPVVRRLHPAGSPLLGGEVRAQVPEAARSLRDTCPGPCGPACRANQVTERFHRHQRKTLRLSWASLPPRFPFGLYSGCCCQSSSANGAESRTSPVRIVGSQEHRYLPLATHALSLRKYRIIAIGSQRNFAIFRADRPCAFGPNAPCRRRGRLGRE